MNLNQDKIKKHVELIKKGAAVFLIDTAQIKRRTGEEYVDGEARPTYSSPEEFKCRLITRSGSESQNIAAQPRLIEQSTFTGLYRMQIPFDLDVNESDLILFNDAFTGNVRTFAVVFAPAKHIYSAAVIIQLQEVK